MYKKKKLPPVSLLTDKAALKIVNGLTAVQRMFGSRLNRMTRNFSATTWKLLILFFSCFWGIVSVHVIYSAMHAETTGHPGIRLPSGTGQVRSDSLLLLEHIYEQRKINDDE